MENKLAIGIIIVVLIIIAGTIIILLRSPEDSWIQDKNGLWIKHGNPDSTPDYVLEQQLKLKEIEANNNLISSYVILDEIEYPKSTCPKKKIVKEIYYKVNSDGKIVYFW